MKSFEKWLKTNGYTFKKVKLYNMCGTGKTVDGIVVDTNYTGMYPTAETFDKISLIRNAVDRRKGLKMETRGYYTGVLVRKAV